MLDRWFRWPTEYRCVMSIIFYFVQSLSAAISPRRESVALITAPNAGDSYGKPPLAVVASGIAWCIDERRVSGVAVTRRPTFVVPSSLVNAVGEHKKALPFQRVCAQSHGPAAVKLVLYLFALLDDRNQ